MRNDENDKDKQSEHLDNVSNNKNNTRTLTQQSSLVAPTEVQINVNAALTAEPVLTQAGKCNR